MANGNNGNQFREDEIIILEQLRDGKMVKNIFPKIGGRLRLAHEENDQEARHRDSGHDRAPWPRRRYPSRRQNYFPL